MIKTPTKEFMETPPYRRLWHEDEFTPLTELELSELQKKCIDTHKHKIVK